MAITDDFNRADGPLGANWDTELGTWAIVSNAAKQTDTGIVFAAVRRAETAFPDDQYAQIEGEWSSDSWSSPAVRIGDGGACYALAIEAATVELRRLTPPSTWTSFGSAATTNTENTFNTWRIIATGTTISVEKDTVELISEVDSNLTSGKPGMLGVRDGARFEDFESTDATVTARFFVLSRF